MRGLPYDQVMGSQETVVIAGCFSTHDQTQIVRFQSEFLCCLHVRHMPSASSAFKPSFFSCLLRLVYPTMPELVECIYAASTYEPCHLIYKSAYREESSIDMVHFIVLDVASTKATRLRIEIPSSSVMYLADLPLEIQFIIHSACLL